MRQDTVSVVVPLYNEAENLRMLVSAIQLALGRVPDIEYELVFVDDGSRDASWELIRELRFEDERIKGVRFTRNFGHQAALTAGYRYATGRAVITMDADLQHSPPLIPDMIARWRSGFDVVSMVRLPGDERWGKRISSKLFYRFINVLSDVPIRSGVADFRLLDRRVVRKLNTLTEHGRFWRGLISWTGFRESEMRYIAARRFAGETKYPLRKMVRLAIDAISSFSSAPLRAAFHAGMLAIGGCLGLMGYALYNKVYENQDLSQWASTFMVMLFLGGIQLLMLGMLGVYVGRIFDEVKRRPVYVAEEKLGIMRSRHHRSTKTIIAGP